MVSQVAASCMSITTKILSYFCYESVKNTCSTCSVALSKTNAFVLKKKGKNKTCDVMVAHILVNKYINKEQNIRER